MSPGFKVVHYLNQFFGGIGGEEKASEGPQVREGAIGLGKAVQDALKGRGQVIGTVICGDNYFAEKTEETAAAILQMIAGFKPDIVIAGPAFNAGRYGTACGEICKAVQNKFGIPAVTGMYEENPGVDLFKRDIYIIKTVESARGATEAVSRMVNLALKLANKEKIGRPAQEGYFPHGIIVNERIDKPAARRAVEMLVAKIKGEPWETELEVPKFDRIKPAPAIKSLASAKLALVTDGGLVPKGNPDKMESHKSTRFATYVIKGMDTLRPEDFEANHIGYDTVFVNQDPNRLVPLDVARELEKGKVFAKLNDKVYATAGVGTSIDNAKKIGQGIAKELKTEGVDGVILTST